jgi:hypothetical protein
VEAHPALTQAGTTEHALALDSIKFYPVVEVSLLSKRKTVSRKFVHAFLIRKPQQNPPFLLPT